MSPWPKRFLFGLAVGAMLLGGCAGAKKDLVPAAPKGPSLPQLIRFIRMDRVRLKPGVLYISGSGSAAADGGKYTVSKRSALSSIPLIALHILSDNRDELEACQRQALAAQDASRSIDIRGLGVYTLESRIDPPLDNHLFTLTKLEACGAAIPTATVGAAISTSLASAGDMPAVSGATSAADLVAAPEQFLDRPTVISGRLAGVVEFMDPVSRLKIESNGQYLSGFFVTTSLPAESRLSLVHTATGSVIVLEGTLTRVTPKSLAAQSGGSAMKYEFDVTKVVSIQPATR